MLGFPPPQEFYLPTRDAAVSLEERAAAFSYHVSKYCTPVDDLDAVTIPFLTERETQQDKSESTVAVMGPEAVAIVTTVAAFGCWDEVLRTKIQVHSEDLTGALFETGGVWNNVDVVYFWCNVSPWMAIWGAKNLSDQAAAWKGAMRDIKFVKLANANHFVRFLRMRHDVALTDLPLAAALG